MSSVNEAVSRKAKKNWKVFPPGYDHFVCSRLCFFSRNSAPGNNRLIMHFPSFLKLYSLLLHTQQGLCFLTSWSNFLNSHCAVWITVSWTAFFWLCVCTHTYMLLITSHQDYSCPDKGRGGTRCSPIAHRKVTPLQSWASTSKVLSMFGCSWGQRETLVTDPRDLELPCHPDW